MKLPRVKVVLTAYSDGRTVARLACLRCDWTAELADPTDTVTSTLLPRATELMTAHAERCPGGA